VRNGFIWLETLYCRNRVFGNGLDTSGSGLYIREMEFLDMYWIHLAQDWVHCPFLNIVDLYVP
jgi:hypothetical protein